MTIKNKQRQRTRRRCCWEEELIPKHSFARVVSGTTSRVFVSTVTKIQLLLMLLMHSNNNGVDAAVEW
jgi:hypothetical protein